MSRRDKHELAMAILKAAKLPVKKTYLMCKARVSYHQLQKYLGLMMENGLIEDRRKEGKKCDEILYETTEKGLSFIRNLELADKLLER